MWHKCKNIELEPQYVSKIFLVFSNHLTHKYLISKSKSIIMT